MKNLFTLGFVALALSLSVAACNSEKKAETTDSTTMDSTATDSTATDSTATDSTATDTTATAAAPAAH